MIMFGATITITIRRSGYELGGCRHSGCKIARASTNGATDKRKRNRKLSTITRLLEKSTVGGSICIPIEEELKTT